jgi:formylglycine-generating enzyme required for sulfatase activity
MCDVFVSYKKEDRALAERVVRALNAQGLSAWWDEGLTPRSAWDAELEREITLAACVVVLWTPRSVESDWVRTEAHFALDHAKLIPAMVERCTIPLAFLLRQTVDLCDWQGQADHRHWRKLLAWIADLVNAKRPDGNAVIRGTTPENAFREVVGRLPSGDAIADGAFVNASTPAGTAFRDSDASPVMRIIPRGAFVLGSAATDPDRAVNEGPQKRIEIPQPFALGVFPVLVSEYEALVGAGPTQTAAIASPRGWRSLFGHTAAATAVVATSPDPSVPVTHVSFEDATTFVTRLSSASGETYRLPSETEWEYACRAGSRSRYAFGEMLDERMAVFGRSAGPMAPGSCTPNAFGVYDMHGNVREWTADLWHESYDTIPQDGSPALEGHGSMRVVRGGGWSDSPALLRSAARMRATESIRSPIIGLRLVRVLG